MEFVIISGMSGAGKSRAASYMEDMGFFCVDNLPAALIPKFAEMGMSGGEYDRVALVSDVRGGTNFDGLFRALRDLEAMQCSYRILFMDAEDEVIVNRYKESRRSHPLYELTETLGQAIAMERAMLEPLRMRAAYLVDTSHMPNARLKSELNRLFGRNNGSQEPMDIKVTSFGYKYGLPMEADLVLDVRFLPNPYYVTELRPMTGLEPAVRDYVFSNGAAEEYLTRLSELLKWMLPQFQAEGKNSMVIAVGCTGGHHRSVAMTHALTERLKQLNWGADESHRDIGRT